MVSDIDGVVTRRNVNPGNHVVAGEELMAVRSLTEIWVDANFKETQLAESADRPTSGFKRGYVREPAAFSRPNLGFHDGNGIDARLVARGECDRQFRKGCPALP